MKPKTITTQIRIPEELHLALKKEADVREVSMNAEIVRRLDTANEAQEQLLQMKALRASFSKDRNEVDTLVEQHKKSAAKYKEFVRQTILLMVEFIADKDKTPEKERDMSLELLRFLSALDEEPSD